MAEIKHITKKSRDEVNEDIDSSTNSSTSTVVATLNDIESAD